MFCGAARGMRVDVRTAGGREHRKPLAERSSPFSDSGRTFGKQLDFLVVFGLGARQSNVMEFVRHGIGKLGRGRRSALL